MRVVLVGLLLFAAAACSGGGTRATSTPAGATSGPVTTAAPGELLEFLRGRFPDWWLPEDVVFVPAIPRTSTGKFLKSALRDSLRGHYGGA